MAFTVNPITNYYSNNISANSTSSNSNVALYEQILALQAENTLTVDNSSTGTGFANDNSAATNDASLFSADLLNLSPAALNILNGIDSGVTGTGNTSSLTLTGTVGITPSSTLTTDQQTQLAAISAEFGSQPLNQTTFTEIENAITASGIDPQQVSLQQLLGALNLAYAPGLSFDGQLYTDTLASELDDA